MSYSNTPNALVLASDEAYQFQLLPLRVGNQSALDKFFEPTLPDDVSPVDGVLLDDADWFRVSDTRCLRLRTCRRDEWEKRYAGYVVPIFVRPVMIVLKSNGYDVSSNERFQMALVLSPSRSNSNYCPRKDGSIGAWWHLAEAHGAVW